MILAQAFTSAMESAPADGTARIEREFTYFGRVPDMEVFTQELSKAATKQYQVQWSIRKEPCAERQYAGELRVRMCQDDADKDGNISYVFTSKTFAEKDNGKKEVEIEVSEDMFDQFTKLADAGMIKTRYTFPREDGTVWEVDVYKDKAGQVIDWIKIDLEVSDDREAPTDFPVTVREVINGDWRKRTDVEKAKATDLLKRLFVLPNEYPKDMQTRMSAEGFMGRVLTKAKPRDLGVNYCHPSRTPANLAQLRNDYRATFLQPAWLKAHGTYASEVTSTRAANLLSNEGVWPHHMWTAIPKHLAEIERWVNAFAVNCKIAQGASATGDQEKDVIKKLVSTPLDLSKLIKSNGELYLLTGHPAPKAADFEASPRIPALTVEEVPLAANMVLQVVAMYHKLRMTDLGERHHTLRYQYADSKEMIPDDSLTVALRSLERLHSGLRHWLDASVR